jgi:hypothetical protein
MENTLNWIDAVTDKSGVDRDEVENALSAYGITGPRPVPPRRRLQVDALHFAGVKNLQSSDDPAKRDFIPFSFTRLFNTPVTALVSDGKNDAGKSSTLDILAWGLRGRPDLRSDVKNWLRQVSLLLRIDDERILIAWRVDAGAASGSILALSAKTTINFADVDAPALEAMRAQADAAAVAGEPVYGLAASVDDLVGSMRAKGAYVVSTFEDDEQMEGAVGDFMLDRLGLETLTQWRRNARATDADDGSAAQHGWPLWSQALVIAKPSITSAIGETPNQAIAVLNTFLATEWSATRNLIRTQKKAVDAELAGVRRRIARDTEARDASVAELTVERTNLQAELDALPPSRITAKEAAQLVKKVTAATQHLTFTQMRVAEAALEYGAAGRALEAAEHDLAALKEAAVTKRFWHSLKPSCCPRCDARVEQEQWEREQAGACSLCNTPIKDDAGTADPSVEVGEDDLDPVELAQQRVNACAAEIETFSDAHDAAREDARLAEVAFTEASAALEVVHGDPAQRHAIELQLSLLDGRIQERAAGPVDAPEEAVLASDAAVLTAAETVVKTEAKQDFDAALESVSVQITQLGKVLGMSNLEKAKIKGNAHLPVLRGGEPSNFSGLTDGERLRLKIALVIALLDVGAESGLGRHPGFLIVDSLAREELNWNNGRLLLQELDRVAGAYGLQVITGTTHTELVDSVLPDEAVVRPRESGFMW